MALPMKKAPVMKSAAMKAMKGVMKAKKVSKMAKVQVFNGSKEKTATGLRKDGLIKNKRGKIVSKKASANGKKRFAAIKGWGDCVAAARKALNLKGFVAINGKKAEGKALYAKAKALYAARR